MPAMAVTVVFAVLMVSGSGAFRVSAFSAFVASVIRAVCVHVSGRR